MSSISSDSPLSESRTDATCTQAELVKAFTEVMSAVEKTQKDLANISANFKSTFDSINTRLENQDSSIKAICHKIDTHIENKKGSCGKRAEEIIAEMKTIREATNTKELLDILRRTATAFEQTLDRRLTKFIRPAVHAKDKEENKKAKEGKLDMSVGQKPTFLLSSLLPNLITAMEAVSKWGAKGEVLKSASGAWIRGIKWENKCDEKFWVIQLRYELSLCGIIVKEVEEGKVWILKRVIRKNNRPNPKKPARKQELKKEEAVRKRNQIHRAPEGQKGVEVDFNLS